MQFVIYAQGVGKIPSSFSIEMVLSESGRHETAFEEKKTQDFLCTYLLPIDPWEGRCDMVSCRINMIPFQDSIVRTE